MENYTKIYLGVRLLLVFLSFLVSGIHSLHTLVPHQLFPLYIIRYRTFHSRLISSFLTLSS